MNRELRAKTRVERRAIQIVGHLDLIRILQYKPSSTKIFSLNSVHTILMGFGQGLLFASSIWRVFFTLFLIKICIQKKIRQIDEGQIWNKGKK